MKHTLTNIFILSSFVILGGCHKKPKATNLENLQQSNCGIITAKLNGKDWEPDVTRANYSNSNERFGFWCQCFEGDISTQYLSFGNIYSVYKNNNIYYSYKNGNVAGYEDSTQAAFSLDEDDATLCSYFVLTNFDGSNYVHVDRYDNASKMVAGRFQVTFYRDASNNFRRPGWPDTLRFTDGVFNLKIR